MRSKFSGAGNRVVIRLIFPLRMKRQEANAKAFAFEKLGLGGLDPEMVEDPAKIVNATVEDEARRTGPTTAAPDAAPS